MLSLFRISVGFVFARSLMFTPNEQFMAAILPAFDGVRYHSMRYMHYMETKFDCLTPDSPAKNEPFMMQHALLSSSVLALALGLFASVVFGQPGASNSVAQENRIILEGRINDQPARFLFDTGASFSALFAGPAARLGLKNETNRLTNIAGHDVSLGLTPPLEVVLLGRNAQTRLPILPFTAPGQVDGVFSWRNLDDTPLQIDAAASRIRSIGNLPRSGWQRWPLDMESTQLFFQVKHDDKLLGRVFVDTGASIGLRLTPRLWDEWKKQNPKAGITLTTYRYAVGEPMVHELSWAAEYRLGNLLLRDVDIGPIPESKDGKAIAADGKEFIATLGMRGLKHLQFIVSRATREVLTQPVSPLPQHNRLGAVFVPRESSPGASAYVAQVLTKTPAHQAGLRTGDVLVSLNGVDFSGNGPVPLSALEELLMRPAGTTLKLTVKRSDVVREFTIVLQDLLP